MSDGVQPPSDGAAQLARARWPWISLAPLGVGAWAPVYAGVRAGRRVWVALGVLWTVIIVAGWILAAGNADSGLAGALLIFGWIGAIATSFTIRPTYAQLTSSPIQQALSDAEMRLNERERARALAQRNPQLALEMGIGRPDLPGATASGVVDINNAPQSALLTLPGVDEALATRIVEARAELRGFSSVAELGATLDLDGDLVEGLRNLVVFLPRTVSPAREAHGA